MSSKKRKSVFDGTEVSVYRRKLRTPSAHPILSNVERKKYTFKAPFRQVFPISDKIIYYIARNPLSSKGHLKLLSTCKFLLRLSQILCIALLQNHGGDENQWYAGLRDIINLKTNNFKLWIIGGLRIHLFMNKVFSNLASTLVKYVSKFLLQDMTIEDQVLTFDELQILLFGNKLEAVNFIKNVVKNADGSITEFEKVFELLCCKNLTIKLPLKQHGIGKNTTNKIIEILSSDQRPVEQSIRFGNIPEEFDFSAFPDFLKANMTGRQHSFDLWFANEISDAYKNQLQQIIDEIIQIRGIYAHTVPLLYLGS